MRCWKDNICQASKARSLQSGAHHNRHSNICSWKEKKIIAALTNRHFPSNFWATEMKNRNRGEMLEPISNTKDSNGLKAFQELLLFTSKERRDKAWAKSKFEKSPGGRHQPPLLKSWSFYRWVAGAGETSAESPQFPLFFSSPQDGFHQPTPMSFACMLPLPRMNCIIIIYHRVYHEHVDMVQDNDISNNLTYANVSLTILHGTNQILSGVSISVWKVYILACILLGSYHKTRYIYKSSISTGALFWR